MNDQIDLRGLFNAYLSSRDRSARYASFDYCYNYFQESRERGETALLSSRAKLELSCLHLSFFLASWGMFRGSGDLYTRSLWAFAPTIELIASEPESTWALDVPSYSNKIEEVRSLGRRVAAALPCAASDILITKAMLGVFGCVPAFDRFFKRGFGASTFGPKSLRGLYVLYSQHQVELDTLRIPTLDFSTGSPTQRRYPMAKVLDMIFFQRGVELLGEDPLTIS
jgi:hypothetical protein